MSAYAALVSLRRTLVSILYPEPRIIHSIAELRILHDEVVLLLKFLDDSSTYKASQISSLEAKMRDAAHKAEDLIEYGILDFETRIPHDSIIMRIMLILYISAVAVGTFMVHGSYTSVWMDLIFEVVFCMTTAVLFYLYIRKVYIFPAINDSLKLRQVICDFNIIARDVTQMTEARGDPERSAHAALRSLRQVLDAILHSHGQRTSQNRAHLECLHGKVSSLLDHLGNTPTAYMPIIRDAVYKAKLALIEFQPPGNFISVDFDRRRFYISLLSSPVWMFVIFRIACHWGIFHWGISHEMAPFHFVTLGRLCIIFASYVGSAVIVVLVLSAQYHSTVPKKQELPHAIDDFARILKDVTKDAGDDPGDLGAAADAFSRQDMGGTGGDVIVGLDKVLIDIKYSLLRGSPNRQLVSIVGMGGIGKTTLARQLYEDPGINAHFDVRAWVTVSQENSSHHALLSLLDSANLLTDENRQDDDGQLSVYLHKHLKYRRYLIVLDDVWDTKIWDFLSKNFPEDDKGSRVLLTSRLPYVVSPLDPSSTLHHMECLDENDSWDLLRRKVLGVTKCPSELVSIGREIAQNCRGLPLAIVVIGGLLCKHIEIDAWRDVAEKLRNSQLQDIKEQCLEILGLSYKHLPHHLRPCFLYMGAFLRDREILIWRLVNLWVAEGFLESCTSVTLEEIAEGYLKDLINRNLIVVCKRSSTGKNRTCSMHDLLRDVCVQNARKENFLHFLDLGGYETRERFDESPRRLIIHPGAVQVDAKYDCVHSILCFDSKRMKSSLVLYLGFLCLRVLDLLEVHSDEFPHQITKLRRLRYLAFHYNGSIPPSISELENLETIVHHHSSFRKYPSLPRMIWRMQNLRHLYVKPGCYLPNPLYYLYPSFLGNLQTLVGIRNFKWSKGVVEKIPNLKKLGISYDVPASVDWSTYQFDSLVDLHQLETLKIIINYNDLESVVSCDPPKLAFPRILRKLSLSGCKIPWESMRAIGELPYLEALKLRNEAFCGRKWETVEGEFPRLVCLVLEEMSFTMWDSEESHFPCLQRLVIRSCSMLDEIPSALGETLEVIELANCHPSAVDSVKQIKEEQRSMGKEILIKFHDERTEVDEVNLDGRGVGPGLLQIISDVYQSARTEIKMAVIILKLGGITKFDLFRRAPDEIIMTVISLIMGWHYFKLLVKPSKALIDTQARTLTPPQKLAREWRFDLDLSTIPHICVKPMWDVSITPHLRST